MHKQPTVPRKSPPKEEEGSLQYDLFRRFIANPNQLENVSNTVEFWENIPKYFFTPEQTKKLRTKDGLAKPYHYEFDYNGVPCTIKFQPALIEQKDGTYKAFFPGITEELIEEALKKIFTDQQYGFHIPKEVESWVRFSLSLIQKELKKQNRSRSLQEIKHGIEIMSSCVMTLLVEGREVWRGPILQDLVTVNREEYIADTKSQHIARLPLFISHAINALEYRQMNYKRLMSLDRQFSRWFYKHLVNRFKQASMTNNYHCMHSNLEKNSGLLQQSQMRHNREKVVESLQEMIEKRILAHYTVENRKKGRSIVDVKYVLIPHPEFIAEQKAANKRSSDAFQFAQRNHLNVDNFEKVIGIADARS